MNGGRMFRGEAAAEHAAAGPLVDYALNTATGNFGGPVWTTAPDGALRLVAIHVAALGSG